jgi:hypothetical protein
MMRAPWLAVALCLALTGQVEARGRTSHYATSSQAATKPDESKLVEHQHYTNAAGESVHSPAHAVGNQVPQGATAKCRDNTFSFSKSHRGTCSHHGGVAGWL